MNAYNEVDGIPCAANQDLLTSLLRDAWGFTGTVVSDYWSVAFLASLHHVAEDVTGAARLALAAGIDVELPHTAGFDDQLLADCSGLIDRAVLRVLTQKAELGLLDAGWDAEQYRSPADFDSPRNRDIARRLAEESVVLLDNQEGMLPLAGPQAIAVVGPAADDPLCMFGCYSFPNHVRSDDPAPPGLPVTTVLDGLVKEFPAAGVRYEQGCGITGEDGSGFEAAVSAAAAADVTVLVVGDRSGMFGHGTSGEGCDVTGLALPGVQGDLADAVLAATKRTVLVVVSGRPYEVGRYAAQAGALVQAFLPGVEGPAAIAGVLSGRVNPSGHLPVQIPGEAAGQPATYLAPALALKTDGVSSVDPTPAFPFGHGLSYTSFAIDRASAAEPAVPTDGTIRVSATVSNTGSRDGATVLQLYLSDPVASVTRPVRQLIGFTRLGLAAGESAEACFEVHADLTSFTGRDLRRRVELGMVVLTVAQSAYDPGAPVPVTLTGETRIVDHTRTMTTQVRPENAGPGGVR